MRCDAQPRFDARPDQWVSLGCLPIFGICLGGPLFDGITLRAWKVLGDSSFAHVKTGRQLRLTVHQSEGRFRPQGVNVVCPFTLLGEYV